MTNSSSITHTGIASLGIALPPLAMDVRKLAHLRGIDPDKFTLGLGCGEMALCDERTDVVRLAAEAGRRAIERWGGDPKRIGLLAVGTETARDMSRPLSAFVAEQLELTGAIRSYEVKHACYGGTVALRQGLEWQASGAAGGKAALVIASDVALYAPEDPGEPTQGAGAVAMVLDEPRVARVDLRSYAHSEPAFDFWRPVGESFPRVDGPLSLECYMRAAESCFGAWIGEGGDAQAALDGLVASCFHVPFPKMVKKAVMRLGSSFGLDEALTANFFEQKVAPTMRLNRQVGNAYTASLWLSVADALAGRAEGERLGAFSYGSGFGSELLLLEAGPEAKAGDWKSDIDGDLKARRLIDEDEYTRLRAG
ncbi:MAG: hydroxymethylglutaryl-CoA synthase family protein [Myxococcota bacterium]